MRASCGSRVGFDANLRGLELVFEQRDGVAKQFVEIEAGELGAAGAGEVEQAVDDLGRTEGLLGNFFKDGGEALVVAHVLGEHLRVAGDDGQRSVDLMRDTGSEQADGGELFGLGELGFQLDAVGDVVDQDDAAYGDEVARDERSDGDVGHARAAVGQSEAELVEGVCALLFADAVEARDKVRREDGGDGLMEDFGALAWSTCSPSGCSSSRCGRRDRPRRRRC